jgi:hypothetical protein
LYSKISVTFGGNPKLWFCCTSWRSSELRKKEGLAFSYDHITATIASAAEMRTVLFWHS